MMNTKISRRALLQGVGASVLLPMLESFGATALKAPPKRLIFLNFGFGPSKSWYPTEAGKNFKLPEAMKPLEDLRDSFSVISNLTNLKSSNYGSHWGSTTFLTGADVRRTPGRIFHNSISCDQVAAEHLGKDTRFSSLSLTAPNHSVEGAGIGRSLAWDANGNPIQGTSDHVALYHQLFGDGGMPLDQRRHLLNRKRSILDAVHSDAKSISGFVSKGDKDKIEEYFDVVRDIELRLKREEQWIEKPKPKAIITEPEKTLGGTQGVEMMFDLMCAALRTDSTRVISYRMPTSCLFSEFEEETGDSAVGAHSMTHYGPKTSNAYKQLIWRDQKLSSMFATLIRKMKATKEFDGSSLYDSSLIVMGSGLRTGHIRRNVPILFAGGGGGGVQHGENYEYKENETQLTSLWLSMLKHSGCPVDAFADSNTPLTEMFS